MTDRFTPTTAAASDVFASVDAYRRIAESTRADQQVEVKATAGAKGFFSRFQQVANPVVSRETALQLAGQNLQRSVTTAYGDWGWRLLKSRVPEINRPGEIRNVERLRGQIERACADVYSLAKEIDRVITAAPKAADDPVLASTFDAFEEGLANKAELLAREFSVPSANWTLACNLAGVPEELRHSDPAGISVMMKASVNAYVRDHGKLPSRLKVIEMAVQHATTLAGRPLEALTLFFEGARGPEKVGHNTEMGRGDFPTEALQEQVEHLAAALLKPSDAAEDDSQRRVPKNAAESIQTAMRRVWNNKPAMLDGYGQALAASFAGLASQAVFKPDPQDGALVMQARAGLESARLRLLMPGSRLFDYVSTTQGQPSLGPQALHAYKKAMVDHLRAEPPENTKDFGQKAMEAYTAAQKLERRRAQAPDPAKLSALDRVLKPELAQMMSQEGAIDAFVVAPKALQQKFITEMSQAPAGGHPSGFSDSFVNDIHRNDWTFEVEGRPPNTLRTGTPQEVALRGYKDFFGGDPVSAKTLSRVLHQHSIGLFMGYWVNSVLSKEDPRSGSDNFAMLMDPDPVVPRMGFGGGYTLRRLPNDRIEVEFDYYKPASVLGMVGSLGHGLPINRTEEFDGEATHANAAIHQHFKAQFNVRDLQSGQIKPTFTQAPQTHLRIEPDWALWDQQMEAGVVTLPRATR